MGFSRHMFVLASQALSQGDLTLSVFSCDRQLSTVNSCKYLGIVLDSNLINLGAAYGTLDSKGVLEDRSPLQIQQETQHWCKRQYYLSVTVWWIKRVLFVTATISKRTPLQTKRDEVRAIFSDPHGLTQNLSLEKWNFVPSTCAPSLNFSYTPVDAHTRTCQFQLPVSLLYQQYKLKSPSNSTHSTTRSQLTLSLCIPSAARRPGTISPLFTSALLWNSLPSPIRSASSLHTFGQDLQKYLGIPVIRPR